MGGTSGCLRDPLCSLYELCLPGFPLALPVSMNSLYWRNELHMHVFLFVTYLLPSFIMTLSMTFYVVQLSISLFFNGFWILIYKIVLTEHSWFHLSRSNFWQLKLSLNFRNLNCCIKVVSVYGGPCVVLMLCIIDSSLMHEAWCEPLQTLIVLMPFVEHPSPWVSGH